MKTDVDWRLEPRSAMFERVIAAVDCGRGEAEEMGDERYVRYCEDALFPFLEAELASSSAGGE